MRTLWIKSTETQLFQYFISMTTLPDVTSPWIYFKLAVFMILLYGIYVIQFRPLNRVRKYGELGYVPESVYSIKETANFVQKRRKVGNIPPPYPNGWFGLMESFNLKKGQAKSISAFGE
jgi:cholesterol 7-dehydrogenase